MHAGQLAFVQAVRQEFPAWFTDRRVLEIGSLDINGSVRVCFERCDYTGIDVAPGPGVDLVAEGQDYAAPDGSFAVVISCEAMEHNPHWAATFRNMLRLCAPGGMVLITCATSGRPEHGTRRSEPQASPLTVGLGWDWYRNVTAGEFAAAADLPGLLDAWCFFRDIAASDLYFLGFRHGVEPAALAPGPNRLRRTLARRNRTMAALRKAVSLALLGERRYLLLPPLTPASLPLIGRALLRRSGFGRRS
ncbi:MAG: class I SAM-dependent methyltransferase [Acidisphaera sp.]|nr:class I SAM-dependent methyltransferase [Acidisphaera sp.]